RARWHAIWAADGAKIPDSTQRAIVDCLSDPDQSVQCQAIRLVGGRKAPLARVLVNNVRNGEAKVKFEAVTALGRIGDPSAIEILIEVLAHGDEHVRFAAATALNRIGRQKPDAWEKIVAQLRGEDKSLRQAIIFAIRETYEPRLVKELAKVAADAKAPARARVLAMQSLSEVCYAYPQWKGEWWAYHPALNPKPEKTAEWSETQSIVGLFRDLLADPQPEVQRAAIAAVAATKDVQSAAQLRKLLENQRDAATQAALIDALGRLKDKDAVSAIIAILEQDNAPPAVLSAAIEAAAQIAVAELTRPLAGLLINHDTDTALAALNTLSKVSGEPATRAITLSLEDTRPQMRKAAVRMLGDRRATSAVPDLLKLVDDRELGPAVLLSLAKNPHPKALRAYLKALESKDAALREQTRTAIAKIADQTLPQLEIQAN